MSEFVIINCRKKYQDFWSNTRNATFENLHNDIAILTSQEEELKNKLEKIQKEKDRILKLENILQEENSEEKKNEHRT